MIYCTADLHGTDLQKFQELLLQASFSAEDTLYVLGDVIDRGENGIDLLRYMMAQPNIRLLMGNHENMLLECSFLFEEQDGELTPRQMDAYYNWMANGGEPTANALVALPAAGRRAILSYLAAAPLYASVSVGERAFFLCHAGLGNFSPEKRVEEYTAAELLWYRPAPSERWWEEVTTVIGHTPTMYYGPQHRGRVMVTDTFIDIDTGPVGSLLRLDDLAVFYETK